MQIVILFVYIKFQFQRKIMAKLRYVKFFCLNKNVTQIVFIFAKCLAFCIYIIVSIYFAFCIYKNFHVVFHWLESLLFTFIYKKLLFARRFYIHKNGKKIIIFTWGVLKTFQIPRALLSNRNRILYLRKKPIIQ